ncbi:preprotein translocase subunit SecE [Demetria terragena]|uniref:preprotein translocase subunit SecE n=1 Tax=Demetria terragena TaxID=63959 RepID=UPI00035C1B09|nr:preprotein translocase subunit SecE [Demetria terragena]
MSTSSTATDSGAGSDAQGPKKGNIFARFFLYVRQVIDEMRKVVWPTRNELVQYTIVVVIFLCIVMAYIIGVDEVFKRLVSWLFSE